MILLAATVVLTQGTALTASDFFPNRPGTRLTYSEKSIMNSETVDVVGSPVEVAGSATVPITTRQNGNEVNTTYYRVNSDSVELMAYQPDAPLPKPFTILRVPKPGKKESWVFEGPSNSEKYAEPLGMQCTSEFKPDREVLGTKRQILQVVLKAQVGGGKAAEQVTQTATYAKGIGLVELLSVTKVGKREAKSELRLTKIEEPKEGG